MALLLIVWTNTEYLSRTLQLQETFEEANPKFWSEFKFMQTDKKKYGKI